MKQVTNTQEIGKAINKNGKMIIRKNNKKSMEIDLIAKLKRVEEEIENGEGIEADEAFRQLRQKYGY